MAGTAEELPASHSIASGRSISIARFNLSSVRAWPIARQFLLVLVLIVLVKQAISVFVYPPFSGHDEVVHFAYVQTVATDHRVPVLIDLSEFRSSITGGTAMPDDLLPDEFYPYCRYVLDWYCDLDNARWVNDPPHIVSVGTQYYPSGWQYAANHPPLYYLAMTPIYLATENTSLATQQYLMRMASIPVGLAVVLLAYAMVGLVFPRDQFLAITVPAFVAFQPQISYEAAMVNNDIAGIVVFSLILFLLLRGLKRDFTWRLTIGIGFTIGAGLLFKSTTLTAIPVVAVAMILGIGLRNWRGWILKGAATAAVAAAISWPWYLYLYRTYGNFSALDQIAENQWAWSYRNRSHPSVLDLLFNSDFAALRWKETWGEFGWRLIHLSDGLLWAIALPCIVATIGLLVYLGAIATTWRPGNIRPGGLDGSRALETYQVQSIAIIAFAAIVSYGAMLQFGTRFQLTQARYFFPAINAFAFLLMVGMRTALPVGWRRYGQAALVAALIVLNIVIYTQYVIPYWYLGF